MTFLLNNIRSFVHGFLLSGLWLFMFFSSAVFGQNYPKATGFVTDQAGLFSPDEVRELNQRLQALDDSTSNEIAIYTTLELPDDISMVAIGFGRENGVGQKDRKNGIVIVIKPKTADSKGQAFIAVGYGLEGAIPDAIAKRIVEQEMIPLFKQGNNYAAVKSAVEVLAKLATGEIKAENYKKKGGGSVGSGVIVLLIVFIFIVIAISGNRRYADRNNLGFWTALGLFSSVGSRHRGSWNNFTGGGGSGGGFGGFGGGSFGGGGAGGSW